MPPQEPIITGEGSTTPFAVPALLDARKIISPPPPSHPTPMTEPAWRPINIEIQLASIQVPEARRCAKTTPSCLRKPTKGQEKGTNRIRSNTCAHRPSTIGKIEAFHKAYDSESWMFKTHQEFIQYWNYQRPHQGIRCLCPAAICFRDLKTLTDVGRQNANLEYETPN